MSESNPLVPDGSAGSGRFNPAGRAVGAGRCIDWLAQGWALFMKKPGIWIAIQLIMVVCFIAMSLIPFLGGLAANLLMPVFIGGVMLGCAALSRGGDLAVDALFAGFKHKSMGNLILVGLLYLGGFMVIAVLVVLLMLVFGGAGLLAGGSEGPDAALMMTGGVLIAVLIGAALMVPLVMAFWFATPLVVFRDIGPFDAMKASFYGCLKNIMPFLLYSVIAFVLCLIAVIPLGLGFLVLGPVLFGAHYAAYMDIFE
jgi:uncharacterized membrane protein